uniref:Uncharacterized protein n=1 Tax=Anguilla anguilla TaxID=7936 RepID=A0A0E9SZL5_ANGAN
MKFRRNLVEEFATVPVPLSVWTRCSQRVRLPGLNFLWLHKRVKGGLKQKPSPI